MNLQDYLMYAKSGLTGEAFPQRKPERIQFPVNDVCNARCVMCNIWHQKKTHEITPEEVRQILVDPLFSLVQGVGLNGGEPTLRRDLPELATALIESLPSLRSISLITNGLHRQRARDNILRLSKVCRDMGKQFNVMVSIDGVGALHDFVRGRDGNFANADGLLSDLQDLGAADTLQIGCTVVRQNIFGLHELLAYAQNKGIYIKYRLGVPHRRLYKQANDTPFTLGRTTWPDLQPFELDLEQTVHFAEFLLNLNRHYEKSLPQQWFYRSLVDQMLEGTPRQAGCAWRNAGVTLTSRGELAYCAVESDVLGDARQESATQLYWNNNTHLEAIKRDKCGSCHHDYGGMPEGPHLRRFAKERLKGSDPVQSAMTLLKSTPIGQHMQAQRSRQGAESIIARLRDLDTPTSATHLQAPDGKPLVVICGWYGTETAGDKAILGGVVHALRQTMGEIEVCLASLYPHISRVTVVQMPELGRIRIVPIDMAASLLDKAALLAFGGGPLMAIPRMAVMVGLFERAAKSGVPSLVAGCGVGPMGNEAQNELVRRLLALAHRRIYRDEGSRELAATLGIDTTADLVAEDPAFTWLEQANAHSSTQRSPRRLLLGLRDWPFRDYASHLDEALARQIKQAFDQGMVELLAKLVEEYPDLEIAPIAMCANSHGGDDRFYYIETLCRHSKVKGALDMGLLGRELTPQQYVDEFRRSTFALTMRFHSLVFAAATGTPCLAIDYTVGKGKVGALASRLKVPQFSMLDVDWADIQQRIVDRLADHQDFNKPAAPQQFSSTMAQLIPGLVSKLATC